MEFSPERPAKKSPQVSAGSFQPLINNELPAKSFETGFALIEALDPLGNLRINLSALLRGQDCAHFAEHLLVQRSHLSFDVLVLALQRSLHCCCVTALSCFTRPLEIRTRLVVNCLHLRLVLFVNRANLGTLSIRELESANEIQAGHSGTSLHPATKLTAGSATSASFLAMLTGARMHPTLHSLTSCTAHLSVTLAGFTAWPITGFGRIGACSLSLSASTTDRRCDQRGAERNSAKFCH
jgi:hypothetical protein